MVASHRTNFILVNQNFKNWLSAKPQPTFFNQLQRCFLVSIHSVVAPNATQRDKTYNEVLYIFDCNWRIIKLFSSFLAAFNQGRLTFLYFFTLSKGMDDAQPFLGKVLSTKLSFRILLSSASRAHPSQVGLWWNSRQLWWCKHHYQSCQKRETCYATVPSPRGLWSWTMHQAPQNEIWNTINQWSFVNFCNVKPCAQGRGQDFSKRGGLKLWKQKLWKGKIACDKNSQESTYIVDKQLTVLTTKPGVPPTKLPSCFSDILSWRP